MFSRHRSLSHALGGLLALSLVLLLAACGGAGSDSGDSSSGGGSSSTATTAGLSKIDTPTTGGRTPVGNSLRATNDGVYLKLTGSSVPDVIAKYNIGHGPSAPAGWLQSTLVGSVSTYVPLDTATESANEFSIFWGVAAPTTGTDRRYGMSNMNNGGTSTNYKDNLAINVIVAAGTGSTTGQEWAVAGKSVYLKSNSGSVSTDSKDRYTLVATVIDSNLGDVAAVADGTGKLYAASGSTLYRITATGSVSTWDFSTLGFGNIHTLVYRHNRLWVGYADRAMYLDVDTVKGFTTLANTFTPTSITPRFCIGGTTLYASDGQSYLNVDSPTSISSRSYLQSSDNVASGDLMKLGEMKSAVAGGVFCSDGTNGYGPYVYTLGIDLASGTQKLFMITPL